MIIKEKIRVEEVHFYWQGSGDPEDEHTLIAVGLIRNGEESTLELEITTETVLNGLKVDREEWGEV